jgi:hypothetical protein
MTSPLISISPHAPAQDTAEVLQAHRFKRVPVIDDGKLLGIVGREDLLRVVQNIPKTSAHEYARSGLLTFLESLIGGVSLDGRLDHRRCARRGAHCRRYQCTAVEAGALHGVDDYCRWQHPQFARKRNCLRKTERVDAI